MFAATYFIRQLLVGVGCIICTTRGAQSAPPGNFCSSGSGSGSGSGFGSGSDSGSDAKYEINDILIVERVSAVQAKKEMWHFLSTLAFIPSDGRSLSQLSLMPDQLIVIDNISLSFSFHVTDVIKFLPISELETAL